MNYITKTWKINGFIYDPHDMKPDWFQKKLKTGQAFEYPKAMPPYVEFEDKRCRHKAYTGDLIHYDEFGRMDVWSAKHINERVEKCES